MKIKFMPYVKAEFDKREKPLPQFFEADSKITYSVQIWRFFRQNSQKIWCKSESDKTVEWS